MAERRDIRAPVPDWTPPPRPAGDPMRGRHAILERLSAGRHADALFAGYAGDAAMWDFMPMGPFPDAAAYRRWVEAAEGGDDPVFYAIGDAATGAWLGVASYLRIAPEAGSVEVGWIALSRALRRTRIATEAMALMMGWAFDAGYRRYEWKCDAANIASRRAAQRLGLSYEGTFRQANVVKGRNRDTAWFAAIDSEWPALRAGFAAWLADDNFDEEGRQRRPLGDFTGPVRVGGDPLLAQTT